MSNPKQTKSKLDYQQLERQRKALRTRLYRILGELEGRPVDRRKYQPFPFGALEKAVEKRIRGVEDLVRRLVLALEKQIPKPWNKE